MKSGQIHSTILCDNNGTSPFMSEHGFSLSVETPGCKILFDTGQNTLLKNAESAGIDLLSHDILILSHGHYDHTGGLSGFLNVNKTCAVMMHCSAMESHYSVKDNLVKNISMTDESRKSIASLDPARILSIERPSIIDQDIGVICGIPRTTPYEDTGGNFYKDKKCTQKDMIDDELSLWIKMDTGLVIITGCCHAGIVNTCEYAKRITGCDTVFRIIGGLHLLNSSKERMDNTIGYLSEQNVKRIIPCHCTGDNAVRVMTEHFSERIEKGFSGKKILFD